MSYKMAELRVVSDAELIAQHDKQAEFTAAGVNYYLDELARRDQEKQTQEMMRLTQEMHRLTRQMRDLTFVVTGATILALFVSVIALFK